MQPRDEIIPEARKIVDKVLDKLGVGHSPVGITVTMDDDAHATFDDETNIIEIGYHSWVMMDEFQKRILIIHELVDDANFMPEQARYLELWTCEYERSTFGSFWAGTRKYPPVIGSLLADRIKLLEKIDENV